MIVEEHSPPRGAPHGAGRRPGCRMTEEGWAETLRRPLSFLSTPPFSPTAAALGVRPLWLFLPHLLGWPRSSFEFFHKMLPKNWTNFWDNQYNSSVPEPFSLTSFLLLSCVQIFICFLKDRTSTILFTIVGKFRLLLKNKRKEIKNSQSNKAGDKNSIIQKMPGELSVRGGKRSLQ